MKGLIAPKWVNSGENTKLLCDYDLGRDAIYSIKWFKDDTELYRYIPTNQPVQYKSFSSPGLRVDEKLTKPNMLIVKITGPLGKFQNKRFKKILNIKNGVFSQTIDKKNSLRGAQKCSKMFQNISKSLENLF